MKTDERHVLLFVDDEPYILKTIERMFEDDNFEVITCLSAEEALDVIRARPVTIIISDYRMPDMDGAELLKKASVLCPDAVRVMLTGYGDIETIISAVNQGQVFRFIAKPWDQSEFRTMIEHCIKQYGILRENRYLAELSRKQNEELSELNRNLKLNIDERTREIIEKNKKLEFLNRALDQSFIETIKFILNLIETFNNKLSAHSKRVARTAEIIARRMNLSSEEVQNVQIASLLHDIGKIGVTQDILFRKETLLTGDQRQALRQHPLIACKYLSSIEKLKRVSDIILHHHEGIDGSGYPFGLKGSDISVESRIIAVADEFDNMTSGAVAGLKTMTPEAAVQEIKNNAKFDAGIADQII